MSADQFPTYANEARVCLEQGHDPVDWTLPVLGLRALCMRCGRTFPPQMKPLLTMAGISPDRPGAARQTEQAARYRRPIQRTGAPRCSIVPLTG